MRRRVTKLIHQQTGRQTDLGGETRTCNRVTRIAAHRLAATSSRR
jgi:hypothetical protein